MPPLKPREKVCFREWQYYYLYNGRAWLGAHDAFTVLFAFDFVLSMGWIDTFNYRFKFCVDFCM